MTFKGFIFGQMKAAGLAQRTWEDVYRIGFPYFKDAFTHKSFRSCNFKDIHELRSMQFTMEEIRGISLEEIDRFGTYEQMEFIGDKQINVSIAQHIVEKYPKLPAGHLTFSFQKLQSEKYLSRFAKKQGFFEHILMCPKVYQQALYWKNGRQQEASKEYYNGNETYDVYSKLVEDVCESFAGALVKAVNEYANSPFGPGMAILHTWVKGIMAEIDFDPTNMDELKPPGIVLRETWEAIYAQRPDAAKKFTNRDMFQIDTQQVGHVPIRAVDPVTREIIVLTVGVHQKDAFYKAASLACKILTKRYASQIEAGRAFKRSQYNEE